MSNLQLNNYAESVSKISEIVLLKFAKKKPPFFFPEMSLIAYKATFLLPCMGEKVWAV